MAQWIAKKVSPASRGRLCGVQDVTHSKIYTLGGNTSSVSYVTTNHEYDPATDTYRVMTALPTAMRYTRAAELNGKIYIVGGETASNVGSTANTVFDPVANTYDTTKAVYPEPICRGVCFTANGRVNYIGGWNNTAIIATVRSYDPTANAWTTRAPMPKTRQFATAAVHVAWDDIFVFGGQEAGNAWVSSSYYYDAWADTWTAIADVPSKGGVGFGVGFAILVEGNGGQMFVVGAGGEGSGQTASANAYTFNPIASRWGSCDSYPIALFSEASGSVQIGGKWTGFVFEGRNTGSTVYYNNTYQYDPAKPLATPALKMVTRVVSTDVRRIKFLATAALKMVTRAPAAAIRRTMPLATAAIKSVTRTPTAAILRLRAFAATIKAVTRLPASEILRGRFLASPAIKTVTRALTAAMRRARLLAAAPVKTATKINTLTVFNTKSLAGTIAIRSALNKPTVSKSMLMAPAPVKSVSRVLIPYLLMGETMAATLSIRTRLPASAMSKSNALVGTLSVISSDRASLSKDTLLAVTPLKSRTGISGALGKAIPFNSSIVARTRIAAAAQTALAMAARLALISKITGTVDKQGQKSLSSQIGSKSAIRGSLTLQGTMSGAAHSKTRIVAGLVIEKGISGSVKAKTRIAAAAGIERLVGLQRIAVRSNLGAVNIAILAQTDRVLLEACLQIQSAFDLTVNVPTSFALTEQISTAFEFELITNIPTLFTLTKQVSTGLEFEIDLGGEINECG